MYFATLHNPTTTYPLGGVTGTDVNLAVIDVRYDFGVPVRLDLFQLAASVEVSAAITVSADGQSWSAVHTFTGNGLLPFTGQTAQHWNVRLTGVAPYTLHALGLHQIWFDGRLFVVRCESGQAMGRRSAYRSGLGYRLDTHNVWDRRWQVHVDRVPTSAVRVLKAHWRSSEPFVLLPDPGIPAVSDTVIWLGEFSFTDTVPTFWRLGARGTFELRVT